MTTPAFRRYTLTISAAALLAGCSGSQPPIGAPGAMPQTSARATHADRGTSWMLPEAKNQDLLYLSTANPGEVSVFSYPGNKLVGQLANLEEPDGECVDKAGDVYIADIGNEDVVEYAHGRTKPIRKLLVDDGFMPDSCAVDPETGDLAITNYYPGGGSGAYTVFVYVNAKGKPKSYYDSDAGYTYFCGYDNKGNLFITDDSNYGVSELPKGAGTFINLTVTGDNFYAPFGVQWDGKYLAVGSGDTSQTRGTGDTAIQRLSVSGSTATVMGSVPMNEASSVYGFWIVDGILIAPNFVNPFSVQFYDYPKGGKETRKLSIDYPYAAVVSAAPNLLNRPTRSGFRSKG
jgi:hypothetical protein